MKPVKYKNFTVFGTALKLLLLTGLFLGAGRALGGGTDKTARFVNSVPAAGIDSLAIRYPVGDVTLKEGTGNEILFAEYENFGIFSKAKAQTVVNGSTLELSLDKADRFPYNILQNFRSRRLEITVPKNLLGQLNQLKIHTISGNITLTDLKAGALDLASVSGSISTGRIEGDTVTITSESGSIKDLGLSASQISLQSNSGSIRDVSVNGKEAVLRSVSGSFEDLAVKADKLTLSSTSGSLEGQIDSAQTNISTTSGNIRLKFSSSLSQGEIRSVSGRLDLTIPDDIAEFEYSTVSGSINIHSAQVRGKGRITVSTTSGNITVDPR